jgi:DNA-binding NarL/FixJ family response regulator
MAEITALKVAIIEDQPKIREGLKALIDGTEGYRCVGSFGSMEEALPRIGNELPGVLLVDIGLPGMSGIEGIRRLKEQYPNLAVLMLTVYDDDRRIFDAMCAGASGYLLKKTPPARLLESLKEVMDGGAPMSPEVARRVIALFREIRPPRTGRLSSYAARSPHIEATRGRPQLQDRGRGAGRQHQHHSIPHAQHLREVTGSFEIRGRRQSPAQPDHPLIPLESSPPRRAFGMDFGMLGAGVMIVRPSRSHTSGSARQRRLGSRPCFTRRPGKSEPLVSRTSDCVRTGACRGLVANLVAGRQTWRPAS